MPPPRGGRDKNDVFVGNIPYGTTEEQLHQIFSEAGNVVNIRLVSDHETGKPKGYAFVEYEDASTALSSIRNLNGYECNGRPLRVNFSNNSSLGAEQQRGDKSSQQERTVKGVVSQMSIHEVYDIVSNMKQLVESEPDKAKQMFVSHPQVAEALLHMQVRLGMLKADDVPSLQKSPPPTMVGGAVILGRGAQLPLLVPPTIPAQVPAQPPTQAVAAPGPPSAYATPFQPPPAPPTMSGPTLGWGMGQAAKVSPTALPQGQYAQQQQQLQQPQQPQQPLPPPQVVPPPPPPPPLLQQQPQPQPQPQPQQQAHIQMPQSQSSWGTTPGREPHGLISQSQGIPTDQMERPLQHQEPGMYQSVKPTASRTDTKPRDPREAREVSRGPRDPRNRYNR